MDIILAPDVYVNASVAPATPPDRVVQRVLGQHKGEGKATEWILGRVAAMLSQLPAFKHQAVQGQVDLIRSFVKVVPCNESFKSDAWADALVASARAAGVQRVVTDHPDLLKLETTQGVEFISTETWLLEVTTPPPPPVG
ncbi:MAG TPA: hypothetical protein VI299_09365 [Polyangiales bacterium]